MSHSALFLFAGLGGGALGFQRASATVRGVSSTFRICGAVDNDPGAASDFELLTGKPCTVADLQTMTPAELRAACTEPPDIVFGSPPCKGFSGCLPAATSKTQRYQDMNSLAVRGIWMALEAWPERPPSLFLVENVPRIQNRGRHLLDQIEGMLAAYGYASRETVHDCGELGGLGQRRRRFLLVARRTESVPNFWFEPPKQPLRSIGDVIGSLPVPWPGSDAGGPMHRLPRLSALNWLRLALVPAGGDWRDLPESVAVVARNGRQNGGFGVEPWDSSSHSVLPEGSVANTRASVADPRPTCDVREGAYGVTDWDRSSTTVIANGTHHNGPWQVADPRVGYGPRRGAVGVQAWNGQSNTVIAESNSFHGQSVADPRLDCQPRNGVAGVVDWNGPARTVIGSSSMLNGSFATTDPRIAEHPGRQSGCYGVRSWDEPGNTVTAQGRVDRSWVSTSDPRGADRAVLWIEDGQLCGPAHVLEAFDLTSRRPLEDPPLIIAADGTWHRPMTTLELAALQSLPVRLGDGWAEYTGRSHKAWRQRIGNAVPPATAEAIASSALRTLIAADLGVWELGSEAIWVERRNDLAAEHASQA